ncbi:phosphatase PAP2 family protein [Bradyrhizobium iriomotense]|uniref:phosphatase PAP2 family protein n=1 Tax=Bradyrhizobium iriomotense TaxID=441950 RepID=UPI001B89E45E|nr:phosphatase PAP2 family protein [Bradyrhizobium iriomotense]MBR0785389.1 phosphatase PAP2 family protein [Bradyrhizobium iriomotense]
MFSAPLFERANCAVKEERRSVGHKERRIANRLQLINWCLVAGGALALCAGLAVTTFTLEGLMTREVLTAPALAIAGLWLMRQCWGERPAFAMIAFSQMGCFVIFAAPMSYIGLGAGMPLQDTRFADLDRLLGLDWPAYFHFAMARPELLLYAKFFYAMILVPGVGVPVVLGLTRQYIRLQQFVMASTLALCVVIVVSSLLPAIGTYFEFGLPSETELFTANGYGGQARDIPMLRDGTLRALNLAKLGGILTFPSFHAAMAVLSIWSLWSIWWLRPALLMLNAGMLVSTPLVGGHYFVDVIAGVSVAALTIQASKGLTAVVVASPLAVSTQPKSEVTGSAARYSLGRHV